MSGLQPLADLAGMIKFVMIAAATYYGVVLAWTIIEAIYDRVVQGVDNWRTRRHG